MKSECVGLRGKKRYDKEALFNFIDYFGGLWVLKPSSRYAKRNKKSAK